MKRFCGALFLFASAASAQDEARDRAAFEKVCGSCHQSSIISDYKSQPEWVETVNTMVSLGAKGTKEQMAGVMQYLTRNWTQVNVNTASAGDLSAVLDVPAAAAAAIVEYRSAHGPFTALDDLAKVPGVDEAKLRGQKQKIAFK